MKKALVALLFLSSFVFAQEKDRSRGPVIFLSGRGPMQASAGGVGVAVKGVAVASGSASYGGEDQTITVATDLVKKCPEVSLTVSDEAKPDYILILNRTPGSFFSGANSQFMLLRPDKSVLYANQKSNTMKAAKDACKAVLADWRTGRTSVAGSQQPNNLPAPATDGWWKTAKDAPRPPAAQK
jgi:hypothetical protein